MPAGISPQMYASYDSLSDEILFNSFAIILQCDCLKVFKGSTCPSCSNSGHSNIITFLYAITYGKLKKVCEKRFTYVHAS